MTRKPVFYIFSGLPGSGKTTLAKQLATKIKCCYLRVDSIEQNLIRFINEDMEDKGYQILYKLAEDNLRNGVSVIADSCNPIAMTRIEFESVALRTNSNFINIEIKCSDENVHKQRVENRITDIEGFPLPDWNGVKEKYYEKWDKEVVKIDTSELNVQESFSLLLEKISGLE